MTLRSEFHTRTISELVDLHRKRRLNLSPAFQRQSVWSETDRRLLIRSILDGVPLPSIYLYEQVGRGGAPLYDVIDGKQRLETILLFLGKGPLAKGRPDPLSVRTSFADDQALEWWRWGELPKETKHRILTTRIQTIEVEGEINEIIDLFIRINSTGKHLAGAEKRHARYYASPVLRASQRLADEYREWFQRNRVVSPAQIQRMKHVELMTELLLAVNAGRPLNKKKKIDEVIAGAALDKSDLSVGARHVRQALKLVEAILPDLKTTRFRLTVDFYTLVFLLHRYKDEGGVITAHDSTRNALARQLLIDFGAGVDEVIERSGKGLGIVSVQEPFRDYLMTVRYDTDSSKQRSTREKLLRGVLDGVFDHLDPHRVFNSVHRRILWHTSTDKRCHFCQRAIRRWEELSIDHLKPYIQGGATDLANADLAHRQCNAKAGAKWKEGAA